MAVPNRGTTNRYIYTFDTYIQVAAQSKEEADAKMAELEKVLGTHQAELIVFQAYGVSDYHTGEEIRPVS
jgi:hypothetical protein